MLCLMQMLRRGRWFSRCWMQGDKDKDPDYHLYCSYAGLAALVLELDALLSVMLWPSLWPLAGPSTCTVKAARGQPYLFWGFLKY
jgi:hypothetical protein